MNFKGTPGPLYIHDGTQLNEQGNIIGCFDILDKPGYEKNVKAIAQFFPYGKDRKNNFPDVEEARANAKLYAAAPDLLAAVEKALEIKQLWFPAGDYSVEHEGEAQALQSMFSALEAAYKKALTS